MGVCRFTSNVTDLNEMPRPRGGWNERREGMDGDKGGNVRNLEEKQETKKTF